MMRQIKSKINAFLRRFNGIHVAHFIELYYPGSFTANIVVKELIADSKLPLDGNVFAYRLFTRDYKMLNGNRVFNHPKNFSPLTYFGRVYSLDEIKRDFSDRIVLIANMEDNKIDKVVCVKSGAFYPFNEKQELVEEPWVTI